MMSKEGVSGRVSIVVKRHNDYSNSYKGKHLIWTDLQFSALVCYHHSGKHDSMKADMRMEK